MSACEITGKMIKLMFFAALIFVGSIAARADVSQVIVLKDSASFAQFQSEHVAGSPNPFFNKLLDQKPGKKNKKVAAALAFPVTGVTGIHRVYLGTAAYVPVVYVGTLGGCLGILPFIDFVVILIEKDISKYQGSRKIFMWLDPQKKTGASANPAVN